jgi:hypothetical protein
MARRTARLTASWSRLLAPGSDHRAAHQHAPEIMIGKDFRTSS